MNIRFLIIIYILFLTLPAYTQMDKNIQGALFYHGDIMVDSVKQWEANNIQFSSVGYYLREEEGLNLKKIIGFYKRQFGKMGYKVEKVFNKTVSGKRISGILLKNDKYFFNIFVNKNKEAGFYYIALQASENMALKDPGIFKHNNKEDNPGFDYKDVPRFKKSVRVLSSRSKKENGVLEEQVIYRSQSKIKDITDFYQGSMNRNGWKIKQSFKLKDCNMLHFKQTHKICDIFIVRDKRSKKNLIVINRESDEKIY